MAYAKAHWTCSCGDFGIPLLVGGYGMSEVPGVMCFPIEDQTRQGIMGRLGRHPDPDQPWSSCRVVDDDGNDVGEGIVGQLIVRTPAIMQGYLNDPAQTEASFHDGWFLTGDLVRRDGDGYFRFFSRSRDIIRRRGENISAAELEQVIQAYPQVREVAAIAVPAELGEDEILVAVVPQPGPAPTAAAIADWCRARLAAIKVPRYVAFVETLPRNATQKLVKAEMRKDATLRARATDLQPPVKREQ